MCFTADSINLSRRDCEGPSPSINWRSRSSFKEYSRPKSDSKVLFQLFRGCLDVFTDGGIRPAGDLSSGTARPGGADDRADRGGDEGAEGVPVEGAPGAAPAEGGAIAARHRR